MTASNPITIHHETKEGSLSFKINSTRGDETDAQFAIEASFIATNTTGAEYIAIYDAARIGTLAPIFIGEPSIIAEFLTEIVEAPLVMPDSVIVNFCANAGKREYPFAIQMPKKIYEVGVKDTIELRQENAVLRRRMAELDARVAKQNTRIAAQNVCITEQDVRIKQLEEKYAKMNSNISSIMSHLFLHSSYAGLLPQDYKYIAKYVDEVEDPLDLDTSNVNIYTTTAESNIVFDAMMRRCDPSKFTHGGHNVLYHLVGCIGQSNYPHSLDRARQIMRKINWKGLAFYNSKSLYQHINDRIDQMRVQSGQLIQSNPSEAARYARVVTDLEQLRDLTQGWE